MERESIREELTLFDLVRAVQDEAEDDREVLATLRHLLDPPGDRSKRI